MELGTIKPVSLDTEMKSAYLDYAMSVIVARALPDVRDGLKPVQRRIMYAMNQMGLRHNVPYRKSAGIVGEVLKEFHPHSDTAVYDAIARMAQDFSLRYPLVDGQGNWGCFTGDTRIKLLDGAEKSFAELAELDSDEIFYVYSVDNAGRVVVGEGRNSRITRRNERLFEVTLDNGEVLRCTADHRFMLRDGTYKAAQDLTLDDSLMPGYFDAAPVKERLNEYLRVLQPNTEKVGQHYNHRVTSTRWLDEYADVYDITVDEHHNFLLASGVFVHNSVDGDAPAAMRYTEARLRQIAEELLIDIDKETVPFIPNYDEKAMEPTVLPARLPNLLLNGAAGIAVGMATNIPPHNLSELADAITYLLDNPDATVDELMKFVPGPDFPTGGIIMGGEGIQAAYATGKGRVIMRAKAYVEESKAGRYSVIVTELPFQVNKSSLVEKIADLIHGQDKMPGAHLVRDESDRNGMRMVIELKRDAQPKKVLNLLYKYTPMQSTFGVNMLALVNGNEPRVLTLKKMLQHHIDWRHEVISNRTRYNLKKARERAHILEGVKIALDNVDAIIAAIRQSRTPETAKSNLRSQFKLSDIQAQAILDMRLARLAALERKKVEDEYVAVIKEVGYYEDLLAHPQKIYDLIRADLKDLKEKYGDERRTRIIEATNTEFSEEDLIPDLQVLVTITDRGYVKRLPHDTYKRQHRGGRGIIGMITRDMDAVQHMITCNTLDNLLFLTNKGKVYQLKAHEVPDAGRQAKGLPLVNLVSLEPGELVTGLIAVRDFENDGKYLVLATCLGKIKKTPLPEYSSVRSTGKIALNLEPGDELAAARLSYGESDIIVATRKGQAIRFAESQVRPMGRDTTGVGAIKLVGKGDQVVGMDVVRPDSKASLLIVTTKGMGKRTSISAFPRQGRAGQGVRAITVIPKGGHICVARVVNPDDDLLVISTNGQVIRMFADGIPHKGRPAQGVAVMNMRETDEVASIARIPRTDKSGKMLSDDELEVMHEDEYDEEEDEVENGSDDAKAETIAKMPRVATPTTNGKDGNGSKKQPTKAKAEPENETPTRPSPKK